MVKDNIVSNVVHQPCDIFTGYCADCAANVILLTMNQHFGIKKPRQSIMNRPVEGQK